MSNNILLKKKLPISVLRGIADVIEKENTNGLFNILEKNDYLVYFKDSDPNSNFFYGIKRVETNKQNEVIIYITRTPVNENNVGPQDAGGLLSHFVITFQEWISALKYYNNPHILDDLVLNTYQKEFYDEIEIIEEDANQVPFSYVEQYLLSEYIENVISHIEEFKTENNKDQIDEIKQLALQISQNITAETKNGVMKQISLLWAKGRKAGLKVSNFLLKEFAKEFLKEGVKTIFETMKNPGKITQLLNLLNP